MWRNLLTPGRLKVALAGSVAAAAFIAQSSLSRIQAAEPAGEHIVVINGCALNFRPA